VAVLFDRVLRRNEALQIDLKDLDLEGKRVKIFGKGRREPELRTLPDQTVEVIRSWLAVRGTEEGPLFTSMDPRKRRPGGRLSGQSCWAVTTGLKLRNLNAIRPSAITAALDATAGDIRRVRQFSRHASVQTVLLYDDAREDAAGQIARQVAAART
jgi:integrase/recombinase XerC